MKRFLSISILLVLAVLVALPAGAQLNGHNLRGDYGLPDPSRNSGTTRGPSR